MWVLFLAQSWALWNTRNKLAIEKKTISNPADIIYKPIIFLQLWSLKFKSRENEGLSWMARELRDLYMQLNRWRREEVVRALVLGLGAEKSPCKSIFPLGRVVPCFVETLNHL